MKPQLNIINYSLLIVFLFFAATTNAIAANFSVTPLIIDVTAEARDISTHTITINNQDSRPNRLYASVNEITLGDKSEIKSFVPASMSDRTTSVTSWIEITRARIDVTAGSEKEIPLTVRINPNTPAGLYHAFVGFASGTNRNEAEAKILAGQGTGVVLRIAVGAKQQEFLRLVSFSTDRFSFSDDKGEMTYTLENTGDVPLAPTGDIIIYDSRGRELTAVSLNEDGQEALNPGESQTYTKPLPFTDKLGKHKAYLSLEYGTVNKAALYDTNFYYSIPWFYLMIIMLLLVTVLVVVVLMFRRGVKNSNAIDLEEAYDLPLFVRERREHSEYEHDIDLKKKDS